MGKYALAFNGVNSYVQVENAPSLNPTDGITVDARVNIVTYAAHQAIITKGRALGWPGSVSYNLSIRAPPDEVPYLRFEISDGVRSVPIWCKPSVGKFHRVIGTWDGSIMRLYDDGVEVHSRERKEPIRVGDEPLRIGGCTLSGRYFAGLIDQVLLYPRALDSDEVSHNVKNPSDPVPGYVLWLPFEEGSGQTVYDKSVYRNNGTIYGASWVEITPSIAMLLPGMIPLITVTGIIAAQELQKARIIG